MSDKPAPLLSADVDVRGLPFMPLDTARLLDSDFFALTSGDEFKAGLTLWCKAWQQVPAASLPDDDRVLAHLSGSGSKWKKVKAMALRGFTLCSDGRWWHPVIAQKAAEAWKHRQAQRTKADMRWHPDGNAPAMPRHSSGTAAAVPRQSRGNASEVEVEVKRSKSEVKKSASVVDQPYTPEATAGKVKGAVLDTAGQPRKAGQDWHDPKYVAATANALGVLRNIGESDSGFKDRVYEAVQSTLRKAKETIGRSTRA